VAAYGAAKYFELIFERECRREGGVYQPDPDFRRRMHESFGRQGFLHHLGVKMIDLQPGYCEMEVAFGDQLSQQHGYFHGALSPQRRMSRGIRGFQPDRVKRLNGDRRIQDQLSCTRQRRAAARSRFGRQGGKDPDHIQCEVVCVKDGAETVCAVALATYVALPGKPEKTQ